jgi:hypothetical protein
MHRARTLRLLAAAAPLSVSACGLFTDYASFYGGDAGLADSSAPTDAIDTSDTPVADADGALPDGSGTGNLLSNPSFEDGVGGCGPGWKAFFGGLTRSSVARTGAWSCLICTNGSGVYLTATVDVPVVAGDSYYAEAWVHAPPSPPNTTGSIALQFEEVDGGPTYDEGAGTMPTADWALVNHVARVPGGATLLKFNVHAAANDGGCLLVDDVGLYKQ